jgi:GTPase
MEGLPIVAIVGRPNVGKSTIFNRIVGERQAIVEDRARTTRDRLYATAEWNGRRFVVIDTGGLERRPGDPIEEKVQEQARLAIGEADVILLVVDAESGETPADLEAAEILRTAAAPVLVAANKADNQKRELEAAEFHRLGWEETYAISALHGRGVADLLDAVVWALPPEPEVELRRKRLEAEADEQALLLAEGILPDAAAAAGPALATADVAGAPPRIAIVGRPNVGKSSLLNQLMGEERAIVSDLPGTTRDTIDTALDWNGTPVRLVDTAGIRRRGKVAGGPAAERFSALRAIRAVGRADVAVLVIDAAEGLTAQDAHVAGYVTEEGTGLVLALNKWDLVEKDERTFDEYADRIRRDVPFLDFAPVVAISARTGQRVGRVLEAALEVAAARRRRVPTAELNRVLSEATFRHPAPPVRNRRPRLYYATQASIEPPTFVLFASDAGNVHFSYKRFLENALRGAFGFAGTPIRLVFRERSRVELEPRPNTRNRPRGGPRRSGGRPSAGRPPATRPGTQRGARQRTRPA